MSKRIKKQKGLERIKHARDPKRLPPEKRFLVLEDDELLDEVGPETIALEQVPGDRYDLHHNGAVRC